jgi:lipid-binding SYLF domain-containing protein
LRIEPDSTDTPMMIASSDPNCASMRVFTSMTGACLGMNASVELSTLRLPIISNDAAARMTEPMTMAMSLRIWCSMVCLRDAL